MIWYASSITVAPDLYPTLWQGDKLFHAAEFFVYGYLLRRGALRRAWPSGWAGGVRLAALVMLTAALDEWHQGCVPTRQPEGWDWVVDVGAGVAGLLGIR